MEEGRRKSHADSFLFSPILRDQDASSSHLLEAETNLPSLLHQMKQSIDTFLDDQVLEMSKNQMLTSTTHPNPKAYIYQLEQRILTLEKQLTNHQENIPPSSSSTSTTVTIGDSMGKRKQDGQEEDEITSTIKRQRVQKDQEVEELRIQLETQRKHFELTLDSKDKELSKIKRQLNFLLEEEKQTQEEFKDFKRSKTDQVLELEQKNVVLETKVNYLEQNVLEWKEKAFENENQLTQVKKQFQFEKISFQQEIEAIQAGSELFTSTTTSDEKKKKNASEQVVLLQAKINQMDLLLKEKDVQVQEALSKIEKAKEMIEKSNEMEKLHLKIETLQMTERKLKAELIDLISSSKKTSILQEQLTKNTHKMEQNEHKINQLLTKVQQSQVLEEAQRRLINHFKPLISQEQGGDHKITLEQLEQTPWQAVMKLYQARQNAYDILLDQKNAIEKRLKKMTDQKEQQTCEMVTLKKQLANVETKLIDAEQKKLAHDQMTAHLRKTNGELVALLETYEKEDFIENKSSKEELFTRRIGLLKNSEDKIKSLEQIQKELPSPAMIKTHETRIDTLETQVNCLQQEKNKLLQHLEQVESENAIYQHRLGKGEFNIETTKVVHLSINPTSEIFKQQLGSLQEENEQLKNKIEQLTGNPSEAITIKTEPSSTTKPSSLTTTTSYETVEGQKLLNQRLKEVFREQIQHYREAVHLLTGYKVEMKKTNGVEMLRLRSTYADHESDELLIQMDKNGTLELLETPFCTQIDKRVFAYLTTCRSFPAFLSNLTLHLFERQTFQG